MKTRLLLLLITLVMMQVNIRAAYYSFLPYSITQPNHEIINCYVSGDEYYNWLHDHEGYTIIQAPDGYFYYGISAGDTVRPSQYKVNEVNPAEVGLEKWAKISDSEYKNRKTTFQEAAGNTNDAPSSGTLNNIVVYIRFSDDTEFTDTRQFFDNKFNLVPGVSLQSYYSEVSYSQLTVSSTQYPACAMTTNLSYQDYHARSYFQPYNATTNPAGYSNESERTFREHSLLMDAINWININSPVPTGLNIDGDNDGYVDNVCFNIRGSNGAWASLLWAHSWTLYSYNVFINGKRVWKYTFQPETQLDVKTLCHEMFHALGAPDLYHYSSASGVQPVQTWDLMEQGFGHMGAYMKWKYSNHAWIDTIPEITVSGTYSLNPLTSATNNCYKISSPNSASQFFVVEYRKTTGTFEANLPGSGLIVYRIDPCYYGNAYGPPDEVYIYRPNGTLSANGSPSSAFYSSTAGRTLINDNSNPPCFLQSGAAGGLNISNITSAGASISFTVTLNGVQDPQAFSSTAVSPSQINLLWQKNYSNDNVMLAVGSTSTFGSPLTGVTYQAGTLIAGGGTVIYAGALTGFSHSGLSASTSYYYKIWSVAAGNIYSPGATQNTTTFCNSSSLPYTQSFQSGSFPTCWSTQQSSNTMNNWFISNTSVAGGSAYEMKSVYQQSNPGVNRLVMLPLNTLGMTQLNLSFNHTLDDYGPGATLRIQSSSDGITWTNEAWSLATVSNTNVGPATVQTTVTSNLNSLYTYIAFTAEGDLFQYDYWYIDNISVSDGGSQSFQVTTLANPVEAGMVSGAGNYFTGQTVTAIATSNPGWNFLNWTENGSVICLSSTYSFMAEANRSLVANFSMNQVTISTNTNPVTGGNVTGGGTYQVGMPVTLMALPNEGYQFVSWTEADSVVSTTPSYLFTASSSQSLSANFALMQFTINTLSAPESGGTTAGAGIYTYNSFVTIVAAPFQEWIFSGWHENGSFVSGDSSYSFQATVDRNLEAYFEIPVYTINLSASPSAGGSTTGGAAYAMGSQVTVYAFPASNWAFINWTESGTEVSKEPEFTFIAAANRNLVANFLPVYEISTSEQPALSGFTTGNGIYLSGQTVTLSAFANEGYRFIGWTENGNQVSTEDVYQFVAEGNRLLEADFLFSVGIIETGFNDLKIYPNPTRDILHLESPLLSDHGGFDKIEIYNAIGELVRNISPGTTGMDYIVNMRGLSPGIYLLRLHLNNREIRTARAILRQ